MAFDAHGQIKNLKLPGIKENLEWLDRTEPPLSTRCDVPLVSQSRTSLINSAIGVDSFNAQTLEYSRYTERDAGYDSGKHRRTYKRPFHQIQSSDIESPFSNVDEEHSEASTPQCSDWSHASSRSSGSSTISHTGEHNSDDEARIGSTRVKDMLIRITNILSSSQPERSSNSKEKHKLDERHRRDMHKKLQGLGEDICKDMLDYLQNFNIDEQSEVLYHELIRATTTGNHKKHNTKTAISIVLIFYLLYGAEVCHHLTKCIRHERERTRLAMEHIHTLERTLQSAGITPPEIGGVGFQEIPLPKFVLDFGSQTEGDSFSEALRTINMQLPNF